MKGAHSKTHCDVTRGQVCLCVCLDEKVKAVDDLTNSCAKLIGQVPHVLNAHFRSFWECAYGDVYDWVSKKSP